MREPVPDLELMTPLEFEPTVDMTGTGRHTREGSAQSCVHQSEPKLQEARVHQELLRVTESRGSRPS